jgi:O-antigen ligase
MRFLRWFFSLCPNDAEIVRVRAFWILVGFILFIFFGKGGTASTVAMGALVVTAALAALDSLARSRLIRLPETATIRIAPLLHLGLAACLGWQILGWLGQRPADADSVQALGSTLALVGLALLVQSALSGREAASEAALLKLLHVLFWAGAASAAASLVVYVHNLWMNGAANLSGLLGVRLVPIGRAAHEIASSAALAVSVCAGIAVFSGLGRWSRVIAAIGIALLLLVMALTQSRGPLLALLLAALVVAALSKVAAPRKRALWALAGLAVLFALPMLLTSFEDAFRAAFCTQDVGLCRTSYRLGIWANAVDALRQAPWFGSGPSARLAGSASAHPHNGLLGSALFYGLPILIPIALLFGGAVHRAGLAARGPATTFLLLALAFAAASLATDRANLFGDLNSHFLFVWMPIAMAFSLKPAGPGVEPRRASH